VRCQLKRTLKQLAGDLNVSAMTVSRALRGDVGVSETMRQTIQEYAREVNYQPNLLARGLVMQRSHVLGVLIPDLSDSFWLDAVLGMERTVRAEGYHILLAHSSDTAAVERSEIGTLISRGVDALLIACCAPGDNASVLADVQTRGIPVVLFDRHVTAQTFSGVFFDDFAGATQAVEHLIGLGRTRIVHLAGDERFSTSHARLEGYRAVMKKADLPETIVEAGFGEESGFRAMRTLLDRGQRQFDAVFAAHDPSAIGALRALLEAGVSVPEEVALVGFGNIRCAEHVSVPLTTVAQSRHALGEALARLALDRLHHPAAPPTEIVLPTQLIVRQSCGYPLRSESSVQ